MPSSHTTNHTATSEQPATAKQLRYLRTLANDTGQTFTHPRTRQQASQEIRRLQNLTPDSPREQSIERHQLETDTAIPEAATAFREDELTGYGSSAHWTHHDSERPDPSAGARRELGAYTLPDGTTRALYGQRIHGKVAISDAPTDGHGRVYLVERHVHSQAELEALVTDYLAESARHGQPAVLAPRNAETER